MIRKDSKILVTGGTGFVGAHILSALYHAGYTKLWTNKRKNSQLTLIEMLETPVQVVEANLNDLTAMTDLIKEVEYVIHAAAMVSFVSSDKNEMFRTNVEGTADVVNISLQEGIKKLVHISSVAAIGRTGKKEPTNENDKWVSARLNTNYARSKHLAEKEVWRGYQEGLPVVIFNPSLILNLALNILPDQPFLIFIDLV